VNIRVLRWFLVALGAALAVVLIVRGNVAIGLLIGAMSVVRAVLLVQLERRRSRWERRRPGRRARFGA
jgi:hypothetical protein